jgi:hypothetical protein
VAFVIYIAFPPAWNEENGDVYIYNN